MKTIDTLEKFNDSAYLQPSKIQESEYPRMLFEAVKRIHDYDCSKLINDFHHFMYQYITESPEVIARLLIVIPIIYEIKTNIDFLKECQEINKIPLNSRLDLFVKAAITIHENIDVLFDDFIFLEGNNKSTDADCHWRVMQVINLLWWIDRNIGMLKGRYEEIVYLENKRNTVEEEN